MNETYYPLENGNWWVYSHLGGNSFMHRVRQTMSDEYLAVNNLDVGFKSIMKRDGLYLSNHLDVSKYQVFLKDELVVGDVWEVESPPFQFHQTLSIRVKEVGVKTKVAGQIFHDVATLEVRSRSEQLDVDQDQEVVSHYSYARNVGLILFISSLGDHMSLVDYGISNQSPTRVLGFAEVLQF